MQIIQPKADHRCDLRARTRRAILVAGALAGVTLPAGGCGSSSSSTSSSRSARDFASAAFRYASCMRSHGVSSFPDPRVTDHGRQHGVALVLPAGVAASPQFETAHQACGGILPPPTSADHAAQAQQQHAHAQELVSFARCVRSRGIGAFPDPNADGQLTPELLAAAGVDVRGPSVLAAARACVPASHGAVTAADIERAENAAP